MAFPWRGLDPSLAYGRWAWRPVYIFPCRLYPNRIQVSAKVLGGSELWRLWSSVKIFIYDFSVLLAVGKSLRRLDENRRLDFRQTFRFNLTSGAPLFYSCTGEACPCNSCPFCYSRVLWGIGAQGPPSAVFADIVLERFAPAVFALRYPAVVIAGVRYCTGEARPCNTDALSWATGATLLWCAISLSLDRTRRHCSWQAVFGEHGSSYSSLQAPS